MQIGNSSTFSENPADVMKELLVESQRELDDCFDLLKKNEEEMDSVNDLIKKLDLKTDRDIQIFSPRSNTDSSFEKLEEAINRKEEIEQENQTLTSRYQKCIKRNNGLKFIAGHIQDNTKEHTFDKDQSVAFHIEELNPEKKLTVLDIQEKERQRIARDLHDTALQSLIHLIHKLELCSKYIDVDTVQAQLEIATCNKHLKQLIDESRVSIFNLRPMSFDDLGFMEVMRRLQVNLEEHSDMKIEFAIDDIPCEHSLILITIYRIIQEACNNSIKHSKGSRLTVMTCLQKDNYYCRIEDNGIGFQTTESAKKTNHFGMVMIQEQVSLLSGEINIQSELGKGTIIEVYIPTSIMKGVYK